MSSSHSQHAAMSRFRRTAIAFLPALTCGMIGCMPPAGVYQARAAAADSTARRAIAREASIDVAVIPANTVSVVPLTVVTRDTTYASLGHGLAALLMIDLSRSAQLTIVERLKLDAVLRELQLGQSGRVDTLTAPKVGRLIGARRIVVGTINLDPRGAMRIDSHVANAATGTIGSSVTGSATLNQVLDAEQQLAFRLLEALGVTLAPAERRAIEQRPTRSLAAFLAFSRGARAEASGHFPVAKAHYAEAVRLDPGFAAAAERSIAMVGVSIPLAFPSALQRAAAISTDLVNRPAPNAIGTAADAPFSSMQRLVTFTITVRTP
jgi:TolB-like protein